MLLESIFAKAVEVSSPQPPFRLNLDSSSKRRSRGIAPSSMNTHHRNLSTIGFGGLDSFAEIRRSFAFNNNRPGTYSVPAATLRCDKHELVFSIASVSISYGRLIHTGSCDPFDYAPLALQLKQRPLSDVLILDVNKRRRFFHKQPCCKRDNGDTSSFYFHAPVHSQVHPYNHSHRRHESIASVTSIGPPVSLYNCNFVHHGRGDSSMSMGSRHSPMSCAVRMVVRQPERITAWTFLSTQSSAISRGRSWTS